MKYQLMLQYEFFVAYEDEPKRPHCLEEIHIGDKTIYVDYRGNFSVVERLYFKTFEELRKYLEQHLLPEATIFLDEDGRIRIHDDTICMYAVSKYNEYDEIYEDFNDPRIDYLCENIVTVRDYETEKILRKGNILQ